MQRSIALPGWPERIDWSARDRTECWSGFGRRDSTTLYI